MSDEERETTFELTSKGLVATITTREIELFSRVNVDLSQFAISDMVCRRGYEARDDKFEVDDRELIYANSIHSPGYLRDAIGSVQAAIKGNQYRLVSRETYDVRELNEAEVKPFSLENYGVTSIEENRVRFVSLREGEIVQI